MPENFLEIVAREYKALKVLSNSLQKATTHVERKLVNIMIDDAKRVIREYTRKSINFVQTGGYF